jgi:nucleotide-binding universal stress UspA family protein
MNEERRPVDVERIVVALDASPLSAAALRAAIELAALLNAEVEGLFVEDVTLLYLCELQSCREVGSRTAQFSRIDSPGMERQLRAQATTIRETMRTATAQTPVPWTFRVLRGAVVDELLAAAESAALMSMGRAGRLRRKGMGSTARTLAGRVRRPLLISSESVGLEYPLTVLYTGTPSAERALALAVRLARRQPERLHVVLWGGDAAQELDRLERAACGLLESDEAAGEVLPRVTRITGAADLVAALRDLRGGTLVLPQELSGLVAEYGRSVLLVP